MGQHAEECPSEAGEQPLPSGRGEIRQLDSIRMRWGGLVKQRKKHGGTCGKHALTEEQERRLEAVGMEW